MYRSYVTDVLMSGFGVNGRWLDSVIVHEDVDAEEIKANVIRRAGLEVV